MQDSFSNKKFKGKGLLKLLEPKEYIDGILNKDITILAKAITLIESQNHKHKAIAQEVLKACLPYSGKSFRLGVTGAPGVGKSTFIENFGQLIIAKGHQLGVLAVDPSSQITKGSILGDKTRMEKLSGMDKVFIRPTPAGKSLGGVARKTRETIILCEAAGFDFILVETVGVGQSEIAVHDLTDFFLYLQMPGAGDDLQGVKRGVMELVDLVAINKSDVSEIAAKRAKANIEIALHLFPAKTNNWQAKVILCSALTGLGLNSILEMIIDYQVKVERNGYFERNRQSQNLKWFESAFNNLLLERIYIKEQSTIETLKKMVKNGEISPFIAAERVLDDFFSK